MFDDDATPFDPYSDEDTDETAPIMDEFGNLIDPDEVPAEEAEEIVEDEVLPDLDEADKDDEEDEADTDDLVSEEK